MLPIVLLALMGCHSIRVSGIITDAATKEPVGTCQVTMAKRYAHSDLAGHYSIVAHTSEARQNPLKLVCDGYEPLSVNACIWRAGHVELNPKVTPAAAGR